MSAGDPLQTRSVSATELAAAPDTDRLLLVTLDGDGDFIVTWQQLDKDGNNNYTDWNIWARRYRANGEPMDEGNGPFRVNAQLDSTQLKYSVQKNPTVAGSSSLLTACSRASSPSGCPTSSSGATTTPPGPVTPPC